MFCIDIAGLVVELDNRYAEVERYCAGYTVAGERPLFRVSVSNRELSDYTVSAGYPVSFPAAECVLIYRKLEAQLPRYGAFLFHAAVICYGGKTVAFSAPRGTGKTTHIRLWQERFGKDVSVINGDKPVIRLTDGRYVAYGTPWQGKERIGSHASAPLDAICFLERGSADRICPLAPDQAAARLAREVIYPEDCATQDRFGMLAAGMLQSVPSYLLSATPTQGAVDAVLRAVYGAE